MRVTSEMLVTGALSRLSSRLGAFERTQERLGDGRRIQRPSDDPGGSARVLRLEAAQAARRQEARNGQDGLNRLTAADGHLQAGLQRLHRVRELATRGATTASPAEREALASEVETIRDELLAIANARHAGEPLFAGHRAGDAVAFDGVAWQYLGDDGAIMRRVGPQEEVQVNVTAREAFGLDPAAPAGSTFAMLDQLAADLRAGSTDGAAAAVGGVETAARRIGDALARIGSAQGWVTSALQRGTEVEAATARELSDVRDVDIAEAVMELEVQQVAYESALHALSKSLPPSLLTFLR